MRNLILIILSVLVLVGCGDSNTSTSNWDPSKCYGRYYDEDYRGLSDEDINLCKKLYLAGCDYYSKYIDGEKYQDHVEYYTKMCGENYVVDGYITQECLDTIESYRRENTIDCYQKVVKDYNVNEIYDGEFPTLIVIGPELSSYSDVKWDSDSNYYITSKKFYNSYYRTKSPIIMLNDVKIYIMERF